MSSAKGRRDVPERDVPERDVESYFQEQVILHGGLCYLVAPRGTKGPPDTVVVWPRDGWAKVDILEIKTIGGGLEEPQILLHAALAEMNCIVKVIWTKAQVDRYVEENGTRQVTGCSTLAGLMERARHSKWYERIKAMHVPRRKKKVAIQLAPPGAEFGSTPTRAQHAAAVRLGFAQFSSPCCANENRSWEGGCLSCGDPCL